MRIQRPGWGPFESGRYTSNDGRFEIFVVGLDPWIPSEKLRRADGTSYGYDLYEGEVKHGRWQSLAAAMAAAREKGST